MNDAPTQPPGGTLWRYLPGLGQLRDYRAGWLRCDLVAGLTVCIVLIPSVIAYAELAGVEPAHGLYAALLAMVVYALFASSRQVIAGPDAAVTLLVASAIGPLARGDAGRAAALAASISILAGALMWIAAWLKIGTVADFLSKPVLIGYMSGAALILIGTQLGPLCGLRLGRAEFFPRLAEFAAKISRIHAVTLALGVSLIAMLALLRRLLPRFPGSLAVFLVALGASSYFGLAQRGVAVLGELPRGLPGLEIPQVTLRDINLLLPGAIGIALLTFPEGILLARAFASKNGLEVNANQELVALGAANVATGLFQGFSVSASQARTTINDAAGGKTQLASLTAAAALGLFLLFLTPLLRHLPTVALASILIFAGGGLIEGKVLGNFWRLSRPSFLLAVLTALGVLVVGVVPGILIGVMFSLISLISQVSRPMDAVLCEVPGTGRYHDLGETPARETVPGLIAYRFYAPLLFSNANHFVERVRQLVAASPTQVRWFLLDAQAISDIDITAAESLAQLHDELQRQGITLKVARANRPLRQAFERIGLKEQLGGDNFFTSVHKGVEAFQSHAPTPQA